ncbi:MAG: hypothetical protein UU48_C0010G0028 [Candidatus Uhrbacteria bacterium GW2011_GWF2_41_16]|uniref:Uncharacterized protein n=2 Tax=Candidatus Uhriibacteriota TaxID=1752732 RepID=A0A0G0V9V9_9BACT|nr:MAG: hypothetical protein UU35_C0008G0007 [Candidatus Uhrbacteria bacterium GW2011_GWC2_41_11]KKR97704.1 MAG: hypothetical protein UU48_C0010G0028 [Candidatus Uhrbacteria bacterium GW2011_GWF2_41_16]
MSEFSEQNPLEQLKKMNAQERIEFFRGRTSDFSTQVSHILDQYLTCSEEQKESILHAFQQRVEDYFAYPNGSHGGGPFDHLPQIGRRLITQEQYETLSMAAAALAATMIDKAGFKTYAQGAYAALGQMSAKQYTKS